MFQAIVKYPIFAVLSVCLLFFYSAGIFFYSDFPDVQSIHFLLLTGILILCEKNIVYRLLGTVFVLIIFLIYCLFPISCLLLLGEVGAVVWIYTQYQKEPKAISFLILALGFVFHLYYTQFSDVGHRQHDLSGILAYMQSITKDGLNVYGFNPWNMYYFFHQPLHFILMQYLYLLGIFLWKSTIVAQEGLQYFSLFYVTATTIVVGSIFEIIKLPKTIHYSALILFVFNPTLFLFSGYVTDDVPILFWSVSFIYFLLRWVYYEHATDLVIAALCFSLGTLTKLSILTLVPAACCLFLYKLCIAKHKKEILFHICIFVIISVPLALLWIIRNHVLFDMPFYNIPDTSPNGQNFKYLTFFERMTDFSSFFSPFINSPHIVEGNIWLALIKTELFGEWNLSLGHRFVQIPAFLFYIVNMVIKLFVGLGSIALFYLSLVKKKFDLSFMALLFFILCYWIIWGYTLKYAMDYPYACSTDYRLFANLILPEIVLLSSLSQKIKVANFLFVASVLYAAFSCLIYVIIA